MTEGWIRTWRVAVDGGEECGSAYVPPGSCRVPGGEQLVDVRHKEWDPSARSKIRCRAHAPEHWPVDEAALVAARAQYDARRQAQQDKADARAAALAAMGSTPAPPSTPAHRHQLHRAPTSFTKLSEAGSRFDPKAAAANDHD